MAASDLTTLANAQAWVGDSTSASDPVIVRLITAVSTQIQAWLGYQVASQSYTRTFDGRGGHTQMLPDRPVSAVASVTVDNIAIQAAPDAVSFGFVFDGSSVSLRGYHFHRGVQNVAIAYTAGYATVPFDIEQACLDWLNMAFAGRDRDPSISSRKAGDTAEVYGGGIVRLGHAVVPMPASVFAALQPYRRVTPA